MARSKSGHDTARYKADAGLSALASSCPTAAAATGPAVRAGSVLQALRHGEVCAKGMNLCPGTRVSVQALKIQIPHPFVISNKSSSLRTQHSKKKKN